MKWLLLFIAAAPALASTGAEKALEKAVRAALRHEARIEVRVVRLNGPWPAGAPARLLNPERPFGLVAFEGPNVAGAAEIRVHSPVIVASVGIRDGEGFTDGNTRREERELTRVAAGGYHVGLDTLAAFRARGTIRPGSVVGAAQIQAPVLVQPGQTVELIVVRGGLQVKARVEALQRGRDQEWIRVRNPTTRKVLQAKVSGLGSVTL